jgi:hypothetical protein
MPFFIGVFHPPFSHGSRTAIGVRISQKLFLRIVFQKSQGFVSSPYGWGEARRAVFIPMKKKELTALH